MYTSEDTHIASVWRRKSLKIIINLSKANNEIRIYHIFHYEIVMQKKTFESVTVKSQGFHIKMNEYSSLLDNS